jgi:hypothetical protein
LSRRPALWRAGRVGHTYDDGTSQSLGKTQDMLGFSRVDRPAKVLLDRASSSRSVVPTLNENEHAMASNHGRCGDQRRTVTTE